MAEDSCGARRNHVLSAGAAPTSSSKRWSTPLQDPAGTIKVNATLAGPFLKSRQVALESFAAISLSRSVWTNSWRAAVGRLGRIAPRTGLPDPHTARNEGGVELRDQLKTIERTVERCLSISIVSRKIGIHILPLDLPPFLPHCFQEFSLVVAAEFVNVPHERRQHRLVFLRRYVETQESTLQRHRFVGEIRASTKDQPGRDGDRGNSENDISHG